MVWFLYKDGDIETIYGKDISVNKEALLEGLKAMVIL